VNAENQSILFSPPMIRDILAGRKTMTRRVVIPQPEDAAQMPLCPYRPGQRRWVREGWRPWLAYSGWRTVYLADKTERAITPPPHWSPRRLTGMTAAQMPEWASRITLEIISVAVERVQQISAEDIIAEGLSTTLRESEACDDLRMQFEALWDRLNRMRGFGWEINPLVWVIRFMVWRCLR
jgi:hypothetical protein